MSATYDFLLDPNQTPASIRKMKILVTGGNGYVGRCVVRLLYDEHDVCVLDNLRYGRSRFEKEELCRIGFEHADINEPHEVRAVMERASPDVVIHLAAVHYIPECEANPGLAVRTNVSGTVNLLQACPPGIRFVFASSGAVYKPDARPHCESSSALEPSDVYGLSKLQGEAYVRYLAQQRDLSAVVVRLFNAVGPGETNPHLLPEIVAQLKAGRRDVRLGNLTPKRDYIHVRDAARGFIATALTGEIARGETITVNLGTSRQYSVAEVVEKLRTIADIDFTLEQEARRIRAVDRPFLAADNKRIRQQFGWEPRHTIEDALTELWTDPDLPDDLIAKYRLCGS